jgi:flotillin
MTVEQINEDRESFNDQVTNIAQKQLDGMGFKITSLGLTDLRDADKDNGYLENLGRPRIAEVRKNAEVAEANSERETRMHKAKTEQETLDEEIKRSTEIAESQKLKDIRDAANKEETERARAKSEQAYELEKTILSKQVQEETLKLLSHKKEEELRISQMEVERKVKLEEESNKIRRAKADADYYETTRSAEALAKKDEIDGATRTKIKRDEGLAEAEVILERGKAEAESKRLLAEAYAENSDLIIAEKLIEMLPKYAKEVSSPYSNIESIKIIDSGNGNGINTLNSSIAHSMVSTLEPLKELTGIDVTKLLSDMTNRGNTHTVVVNDIVEDIVKEVPVTPTTPTTPVTEE